MAKTIENIRIYLEITKGSLTEENKSFAGGGQVLLNVLKRKLTSCGNIAKNLSKTAAVGIS